MKKKTNEKMRIELKPRDWLGEQKHVSVEYERVAHAHAAPKPETSILSIQYSYTLDRMINERCKAKEQIN